MNKSKKTFTILVLSIITFAFLTACSNPFFPGPKKPAKVDRGIDEIFAVNIVPAFESDFESDEPREYITLTAEVTGSGGGKLTYQWFSSMTDRSDGGTAIPGETGEVYEPPLDNEGRTFYYIEVTNVLNGKTSKAVSNTVGIIIDADGNIEVVVSEIETPTVTIAVENDGAAVTLTAAASVSDGGELTYQWYRNNVDRSEGGTAISGETTTVYTPPVIPDGTSYYYVRATNTLNGRIASAASHTVKVVIQGGAITEVIVSDTVETPIVSVTPSSDGVNVTLTASASVGDGGELTYRWYKNTLDSSKGGTYISGATGPNYALPITIDGTAYYYVKVTNNLRGQTADAVSNTVRIVIRDGGIVFEEIIVSATVESPLVNISAVNDGGVITIMTLATVGDGGELSYRWYKNTVDNSKNGALITGATETTYTPPTDDVGEAYYYVKVTNALNGQTADAVSGTVRVIIQNGGITEVIISDTVRTPTVSIIAAINDRNITITASASVSDWGTLSYQWYRSAVDNSKSGALITGATGTTYTYTLPSEAAASSTYYYVRVTNTLKGQTASAVSNVIGIIVREEGGNIEIINIPDVETPTVSITADVVGKNVTITLEAFIGDGGTLTYQWYSNNKKSTVGGTAEAGATGITYAPPTNIPGTIYYYVEVTNTLNRKTASAVSNIVGVVVPEGSGSVEVDISDVDTPRVTIAAAVTGRSVTIMAAATVNDGGTITYQWYRNYEENNKTGDSIFGATGNIYAPPTLTPGTMYYYVIATNTLNGFTADTVSNVVRVVVPTEGNIDIVEIESAVEIPVITIEANAVGRNVTLTADASVGDGGVITYQWYSNNQRNKNGEAIDGATRMTYDAPTAEAGTTYYYCLATNTLNGYTARATSNIVGVVVPATGDIELIEAEVPVVTMYASPAQATYAMGHTVTLTASAQSVTDGGILSYQWYSNSANSNENGTELPGAVGYVHQASTETLGTTYYYVIATNTLHGKKASAASNAVKVEVVVTPITLASLSITGPGKAATPNTLAYTTDPGYSQSTVAWRNSDNTVFTGEKFEGSAVYIAEVTLAALPGYAFVSGFKATINGSTEMTLSNQTAEAVTASYTFPMTSAREVLSVTVDSEPTKMSYQHGDSFNLDGLKLKVTYDDTAEGDDDAVTVADLAEKNINVTTDPAHGNQLLRSARNGRPIAITVGGKVTISTEHNLTVTAKGLTVTGVTHTKVYDGTATVNQNILAVTPTSWSGVVNNEVVTVATVTGEYTAVEAGTATMNISAGTVSGSDSANYDVVASNDTPATVTGGITKATPTVTWPTGLSGIYGNALSSTSLTTTNGSAKGINNGDLTGGFAWTTSTTLVGAQGTRSHSMTFTPSDTTNYSAPAQNVDITVNARAVTLTVVTPTRTLIPIDSNDTSYDTTTPFTVTLGNMVGSDTVTVSLATNNYGITLSGNTGLTGGQKTLTLMYSGATVTQTTPLSLTLSITGNGNYTTSGTPTVTPTVYDGQTAARAIPVTTSNFSAFNTYAASSSRHFKLMSDIPLTAPSTGSNWTPIAFAGTFDGQGNRITNLTIRLTGTGNTTAYAAMFSSITGTSGNNALVRNLGLVNVNISSTGSSEHSAGLVGNLGNYGQVLNCYVTGSVSGNKNAGGLAVIVSGNSYTVIRNCYVTANVSGANNFDGGTVGGLVAALSGAGYINNCYVTGNVSSSPISTSNNSRQIGGLVGSSTNNAQRGIQYCYVTGNVSCSSNGGSSTQVGGLVGSLSGSNSNVTKCVVLSNSITAAVANTTMARVYNGTGYSIGRLYTKTGITMTRGGVTYTPTSTTNSGSNDGADTTAWNTQSFYTTTSNWGSETSDRWSFSGTDAAWEWSTTKNLPILRNMPTGTQ